MRHRPSCGGWDVACPLPHKKTSFLSCEAISRPAEAPEGDTFTVRTPEKVARNEGP